MSRLNKSFWKVILLIGVFVAVFALAGSSASAYPSLSPRQQGSLPSRPNRGLQIQSVTDGENVMWFDNPNIVGLRLLMSTGRDMDLHNTASPWNTSMLHTVRPPNGACLEAYIYHSRETDNTMRNYFAIAPWCSGAGSNTYFGPMDNNFTSKYIRTAYYSNWNYPIHNASYQDEMIWVQILKWNVASNCWSVYLYNYNTDHWDAMGNPNYVCGTPNEPYPAYNDGWTSFEQHFKTNTVCGTLLDYHTLESRTVQNELTVGGAFTNVASGTITYTDLGATQCEDGAWSSHHVTSAPYGYVLCAYALVPDCDGD